MRVLDEVSFAGAEVAARSVAPGDHCVGIVEDAADASRVACPFIEAGLCAGERVLVWVSPEVRARIEDELGDQDAERLRIVDSSTVYVAPFDGGTLVERVVEIGREEATPLRIVGQPPGDALLIAPVEEWERYEVIAHEACVANGIAALCLWDASAIPPALLDIVRRSHSLIDRDDAMRRNPDFVWAG
jgi:hypothetical protein